jgi:adenine-specific DNA-methyltransferase
MSHRKMAKSPAPTEVDHFAHDAAKRKNIPTAENQGLVPDDDKAVKLLRYPRNPDLDPQLVWRGKDAEDGAPLEVAAPPIYIQEKIHPRAIIENLRRQSKARKTETAPQIDFFHDFNGLEADPEARTEFYAHDHNWQNRMILGDSLQVMGSLAEREALRGKVQCIYFDPPYGINFNSNWQPSTKSTKVKNDKEDSISREPEVVRAFRDTWKDGINSYLSYLRDRLCLMRDMLSDSGSVFVQIGDESVSRVRILLDEIFGENNFVSLVTYKTSVGLGEEFIDNTNNYLIWFSKNKESAKFRALFKQLKAGETGATRYKTVRLPDAADRRVTEEELADPSLLPAGARLFRDQGLTSRTGSATTQFEVPFQGRLYRPSTGGWRTAEVGMKRAIRSDRIMPTGKNISFRKFFDDFDQLSLTNFWDDVSGGITSRADPKVYVVQTANKIIERCILMTTDPGDLVLDPTCGSGTTAMVAENWRGGSVCLNSFWSADKWFLPSVMPQPGLAAAH